MAKSVLKVPGPRLHRLISHLFYPLVLICYLLIKPSPRHAEMKKESWGLEMQNTEMWKINGRF